jgi:adenine phosphoribosyltransferase
MELTEHIRDVLNFPKPGINFKDITPLLNNPEARNHCLSLLLQSIEGRQINKIIGIESRGFFFAILIAQKLNVGFVPIRKKGKLPFDTISASYELEYGTDTLQMHTDAIKKGDRVLIHDDVLATGGTARAACELVERAGGTIVQCNFLMELSFLNGREKINGHEIFAALKY